MKTLTETKTTIDFDIDNCESEAVIENRVIKSVKIHLKGDQNNSFISNDEQFIRDVHKALSGLILHLDKERGFVDKGQEFSIGGTAI